MVDPLATSTTTPAPVSPKPVAPPVVSQDALARERDMQRAREHAPPSPDPQRPVASATPDYRGPGGLTHSGFGSSASMEGEKRAAEDQDKRTKRAEVLSDETPKTLSPKDRLEAFVVRLRAQHKHNAPITPALVQEVESILAAQQGKDKAPVSQVYYHALPRPIVSRKDDGTVVSMVTAEDALNYMKDNVKRDAVSKTYWDKTEELLHAAIEDPTPFKLEVAANSLRDSMGLDRNRKSPDALAKEKVANPLTGFNHPGGVPQNAYGADDI